MLVTLVSLVVALSILVFVHELGHYLAAKLSKVVVEEFGFGYPPRLFTFWHTKGKAVIDGREVVIPRDFDLPKELLSGSEVYYRSEPDAKGRQILTWLEVADPEDPSSAQASGHWPAA